MHPCVVFGRQQNVAYGSRSSRGFNQRLEKELWRVMSGYRKEAYILGYVYKYQGRKNVDMDTKEISLEAIEAFGEDIDEKVTPTSSSHLFIVNKQAN